jgi:hypothetical protein
MFDDFRSFITQSSPRKKFAPLAADKGLPGAILFFILSIAAGNQNGIN